MHVSMSLATLYCTVLYYTVPDPARRVVEAGHLVGGEAAARQDHRVVIIDDTGQAENVEILVNGDRHIDTLILFTLKGDHLD